MTDTQQSEVERVARAICGASLKSTWEFSGERGRHMYRRQAKAALATLRPVSEAEVREVLEPFADAADKLNERQSDAQSIWAFPAAIGITVGDLRRARALLNRLNQAKTPTVSLHRCTWEEREQAHYGLTDNPEGEQ